MENTPVIGVVVFSGLPGNQTLGVLTQPICSRDADIDRVPITHHVQHRSVAGCWIFGGCSSGAVVVWPTCRGVTARLYVIAG